MDFTNLRTPLGKRLRCFDGFIVMTPKKSWAGPHGRGRTGPKCPPQIGGEGWALHLETASAQWVTCVPLWSARLADINSNHGSVVERLITPDYESGERPVLILVPLGGEGLRDARTF
jgi:hypothetical protein